MYKKIIIFKLCMLTALCGEAVNKIKQIGESGKYSLVIEGWDQEYKFQFESVNGIVSGVPYKEIPPKLIRHDNVKLKGDLVAIAYEGALFVCYFKGGEIKTKLAYPMGVNSKFEKKGDLKYEIGGYIIKLDPKTETLSCKFKKVIKKDDKLPEILQGGISSFKPDTLFLTQSVDLVGVKDDTDK